VNTLNTLRFLDVLPKNERWSLVILHAHASESMTIIVGFVDGGWTELDKSFSRDTGPVYRPIGTRSLEESGTVLAVGSTSLLVVTADQARDEHEHGISAVAAAKAAKEAAVAAAIAAVTERENAAAAKAADRIADALALADCREDAAERWDRWDGGCAADCR